MYFYIHATVCICACKCCCIQSSKWLVLMMLMVVWGATLFGSRCFRDCLDVSTYPQACWFRFSLTVCDWVRVPGLRLLMQHHQHIAQCATEMMPLPCSRRWVNHMRRTLASNRSQDFHHLCTQHVSLESACQVCSSYCLSVSTQEKEIGALFDAPIDFWEDCEIEQVISYLRESWQLNLPPSWPTDFWSRKPWSVKQCRLCNFAISRCSFM